MSSKYDKNGKFLGVNLESLSQLEGGEYRLIKSAPHGLLSDVGGRGNGAYYGLRLAFCNGVSARQALVEYMGSPAWINLYFEGSRIKA